MEGGKLEEEKRLWTSTDFCLQKEDVAHISVGMQGGGVCWAERLILKIRQWNPGFTDQQLREGFKRVKESGVYEVDFFGDIFLGGIACGIQKRILIFNTSDNIIHDPIAVTDPTHYDSRIIIQDETPIVVAYNNFHYENLHPIEEQDTSRILCIV